MLGPELEEESKEKKAVVSIALDYNVFLKIVISNEYFRKSIVE